MLMTLEVIAVLIIDLVWGQIKGVFKFNEKHRLKVKGCLHHT